MKTLWFLSLLLLVPPVYADIGPPPGRKRIRVSYRVKLNFKTKRVLMQVAHSSFRKAQVTLAPLPSGKVFNPLSGYRTYPSIVAFSAKEAAVLLELAKKHPDPVLVRQRKALNAVRDPLKWLKQWHYANIGASSKGPGPLATYLHSKDRVRSQSLATHTEVDSSFPARLQIRTLTITGVKGQALLVKQSSVTYQTAKGQSVVMKDWKSRKKQGRMFLIAGVVLGIALLGIGIVLLGGENRKDHA